MTRAGIAGALCLIFAPILPVVAGILKLWVKEMLQI